MHLTSEALLLVSGSQGVHVTALASRSPHLQARASQECLEGLLHRRPDFWFFTPHQWKEKEKKDGGKKEKTEVPRAQVERGRHHGGGVATPCYGLGRRLRTT